jgi:hypothetical protein
MRLIDGLEPEVRDKIYRGNALGLIPSLSVA